MGNELPVTASADALEVHLAFDHEAKVWYIADSDIPGLHLEADSPIKLLERIIAAAPELIELNGSKGDTDEKGSRKTDQPVAVRPVFDAPFALVSR